MGIKKINMNKFIKYNLFLLLVTGLIACNSKSGGSKSDVDGTTSSRWVWPDSIKNELLLPDSIIEEAMQKSIQPWEFFTLEQLELALTINKIANEYWDVEDNRFVFRMRREDFLKTNIPEVYYDWILSGIVDHNDYFTKYTEYIEGSLDSMHQRWKEERKEYLLEMERKIASYR